MSLTIGRIRGYAATFGDLDRQGHRIHPDAFSRWLSGGGQRLPLYHQHVSKRLPIGYTTRIAADKKGLRYEAEILDTTEGRDALVAIRAGAVRHSSFRWIDGQGRKADDGSVVLTRLTPVEISIVGCMPANPAATTEIADEPRPDPAAGR